MYEGYIRPQENNHRTDIHWCAFTNKAGAGPMFIADKTFEINASPYLTEDLNNGDDIYNSQPLTEKTNYHHLNDPKPQRLIDFY